MLPSFSSFCFLVLSLISSVQARCYDPTPAFPPRQHHAYKTSKILSDVLKQVADEIKIIVKQPAFDISSFSVEVTTSKESLWELHHTAREKDLDRPGAEEVNGNSVYRMASVSKCFTTLAIIQQHVAGNLSLDDTIDAYLPELNGSIPWKDITLRTIASQLSGIPREFVVSDLLLEFGPVGLGLPPIDKQVLPQCGEEYGYDRPCSKDDLLGDLSKQKPIYPPKQKSSYSNLNFELLGFVIEKVTGITYTKYVETSILQPLVLPKLPINQFGWSNYWDIDESIANPTGGLFSSSSDMSKFNRYVLQHYNGLTPQINWFQPASYSTSISSFYGTPWEIFRTNSILSETSRPVTFVTKSGSVPGYLSYIILLPEYDLGITILTATETIILKDSIRETLTAPLVKAAEQIAQNDLATRYAGRYTTGDLNSTLVLAHSATRSLFIETFVSNGTDFFTVWQPLISAIFRQGDSFRIQLVPTLLYRDEENQRGEIWRGVPVPEPRRENLIWDDFCLTDEDLFLYAGKPGFEFVFWGAKDGDGTFDEIELSAFRVKLKRDINPDHFGDGVGLEGGSWRVGNGREMEQQHVLSAQNA